MRKTLQHELDRFFGLFESYGQLPPSKQAFSKARMKLSPTAFIGLNDRLVGQFYADGQFKHVKGYRLLGIDGSTLYRQAKTLQGPMEESRGPP